MSRSNGVIIKANGDKVWFCEIRIGDWCQTLSCLRMETDPIWPDLRDVPTTNLFRVAVGTTACLVQRALKRRSELSNLMARNQPVVPSVRKRRGTVGQRQDRTRRGYRNSSPDCPSDRATMVSGTRSGPVQAALAETSTGSSARRRSSTDLGKRFVEWLKINIREGLIEINTPRARSRTGQKASRLITPGIFRDFSPTIGSVSETLPEAQAPREDRERHQRLDLPGSKDRRSSTVKVMVIPPDAETVPGIEILQPNPVMTLLNADQLKPPVQSAHGFCHGWRWNDEPWSLETISELVEDYLRKRLLRPASCNLYKVAQRWVNETGNNIVASVAVG